MTPQQRSEVELFGQLIMHLWVTEQKVDLLTQSEGFVKEVKFFANKFRNALEKSPYFNKLLSVGHEADRHAFDLISTHTQHLIEYISKLQLHKMGTDDMTVLSICAVKIMEDRNNIINRLAIPIGNGEEISDMDAKVKLNNTINGLNKLQFEQAEKYINNFVVLNNK